MKRIYLIIRWFDFYRTIIFHLIKFYILIYRKNIQVARTNDKNVSPSSRVYIINIKFIRNKCSINVTSNIPNRVLNYLLLYY